MFDEKEYMKNYREKNKEKESLRKKIWNEKNKERAAARDKAWQQANPEKVRARNERYFLKLSLANKKVSGRTLAAWAIQVKERDCYTCRDCGSTENLDAHHIYSKKKHPELILDIDNGTTLCESCHKYEHKINGVI